MVVVVVVVVVVVAVVIVIVCCWCCCFVVVGVADLLTAPFLSHSVVSIGLLTWFVLELLFHFRGSSHRKYTLMTTSLFLALPVPLSR